jgi:sec-independent protein translocase protein TatB
MFDFSFGELALIGAVSLVVLGPERLPKVARTVGEWVGKAQRYVQQVKGDIQREIELSELKKLQEEARSAAAAVQQQVDSVQSSMNDVSGELQKIGADADATPASSGYDASAWEDGGSWRSHAFRRRYRPGPSVDQLAEELERLKRQLAMPTDGQPGSRGKYARRSRVNRTRIRR